MNICKKPRHQFQVSLESPLTGMDRDVNLGTGGGLLPQLAVRAAFSCKREKPCRCDGLSDSRDGRSAIEGLRADLERNRKGWIRIEFPITCY